MDYGDLTNFTLTNDEITNAVTASSVSLFRYDLKGASSLEQAITSSPDNGTTFFEQTLTLNLQKLTKEDMLEFKLIAYGRPLVIVMDNNDNFFLAGKEHGMSVSGGSITTGAAFGDMSGTTLTLSGQEKLPANFISGATFVDPFAGLETATGTVVPGTNS
tara:strand:- start:512 stop:991 length:480 start_codon:yes stop_codon:yes gene_type:complete